MDPKVVYAKARAAKQREYLSSVRRQFYKKVLPKTSVENQNDQSILNKDNNTSKLSDATNEHKLAGQKRAREDETTGSHASGPIGIGKMQSSTSNAQPLQKKAGKSNVKPEHLPAEIAADRKKAKKMSRLLSQPNRFTPSLKKAVTAAEERDKKRQEAERHREEGERRQKERKKVSKQYAQRSKSGQPLMNVRAKDLLRKIERITSSSGSGGK